MTTKLTLTVEKEIIEKAKIYAKNTDRSLSKIVESYLDNLIKDSESNTIKSAKLTKLVGSIKVPKNFDEKIALSEYFNSKHK
ncbi:MAG: DUF6364 family protein [Chitinophagales bacterium]|nr:DUF6364 family protein [Chitinophagales bacterium]